MKNDRLIHLENLIANNQSHFHATGKALKEIKDNRLYKQTFFKTFEAYAKDRWDMGKSQVYRLIDAYQVVNNLSPIGEDLPANESQVRSLTSFSPLEQRKIWKGFLNTGMEKTAHNIKKFTVTFKVPGKAKPVDLTDQISTEYMVAVQAMLEQVQLAQNDCWQKTSRQAGLLWNRVIQDKIISKNINNDRR